MWFAVIRPITWHPFRFLARTTTLATNSWNTLDQRQQLRDVMAIRARQTHREWNASALHQQMMLAPQFAPIHWAFAGFLAPVTRSHTRTINHPPLPRELPPRLEFGQDALPQLFPDAPPRPFEEPAAAGMTRRKIARRGKVFPRHSGLQNKDDA